jgi:hypothetical protein
MFTSKKRTCQINFFESKHPLFREGGPCGCKVSPWDGKGADRPAEKDLEQNLFSIRFERSQTRQLLILTDDHRYP